MRRTRQISVWTLALLATGMLGLPGGAAAQTVGPFTSFPTGDVKDGRFLAAVAGLEGLTAEPTIVGISVEEGIDEFAFRIFDGDTFKPCAYDGVSCFVPFRGHWDDPVVGGTNQLVVEMYEDPLRTGDPTDLTPVGSWLGNDPNPLSGPLWTADQAEMPDNDWWTVTVQVAPSARAPSGAAFYLVKINLQMEIPAAVSDYKISASVPLSIFSASFGFEAGAGGSVNDLAILYPDSLPAFQAVPCDAATGCNDSTEIAGLVGVITSFPWHDSIDTSTYDGTYNFFLNVSEEVEELTIWDGDFDFGTVNDANGNALPTLFQNLPLTACFDNDDANTPNPYPPGFNPGAANPETAVTNLAVNSPADDNQQDPLLRPGCVTWKVIDPLGNEYANLNPSSNLEWERFVISINDPTADHYVPEMAALPPGTWQVVVEGLDLSNSNFWKFDFAACGAVDGSPVCPQQTVKVGDTVFQDTNGDGDQDVGEPGINGCQVKLLRFDPETNASVDTGRRTVTRTIDGVDGMYMFDVDFGSLVPPVGEIEAELIEYTVEIAPECLGDVPTGSVGDRVWFDLDGDTVGGDTGMTDGEAGIPGVTVVVRECSGGVPGPAVGSTRTDADGFYTFDNLALGVEYCTQVTASTLPPGLSRTNGAGTLSGPVTIDAATPTNRTLDFGYQQADPALAALGNEVWVDLDNDGVRDGGEPGLENALVELRKYANDDCTGPLSASSTDVTDATGFYYFGGLTPGCYEVTVQAGSLPSGLVAVYDLDDGLAGPDGSAARFVAAGEIALDVDFGYDDDPNDAVQALYCISDYTWYDGDRDGVFDGVNGSDDGTDAPLAGVTVTLRNGLGEAVATTLSDADGFFELCGLPGDDPSTPAEIEGQTYVIEITDADGVLSPFTGTTQAGVDGELEVLLTDGDADGVNFGYVDEGPLEQCAFEPSPPLTGTSITGGGERFFDPNGELQNDLDFDFGCRPLYSVGDRVWLNVDGDADGGDFGEEVGLAGVTVKLLDAGGGQIDSAITAADGFYRFDGLLPGSYTVMVDGTTLPADLVQNFDPDAALDGMHSFALAPDLPLDFFKTDVDFGYAEACGLSVEKTCQLVIEPAPFDCSNAKPIDVLTMIWNGGGTVDVTAWKGSVGSTSLGTKTVSHGQEVFFSGFAGSPNDVSWEIFAGGVKIGESKFHLSCSDPAMNGTEDCGLPQGDGKSDDAGLINNWRLEGLAGNGQVLDCTPTPAPPAETCDAVLGPTPSCETTGDPDFLTWKYSGGGCSASLNSQAPDKVECTESSPGIDPDAAITVEAGNDTFVVQPGKEFTLKRSDSDEILLTQPDRFENHKIHVSCSQPLIAGERYGSLTLAALDGQRAGVSVIYDYLVSNSGPALSAVTLEDDKLELGIAPFGLGRDGSQQFSFITELTETTTNRADVSGLLASGGICSDFATATVNVAEPPEPCGECDGGVNELTLVYTGPDALVTIYDDKDPKTDEILFDGFVPQGGQVPLLPRPGKDKFDSNISAWIAGQRVTLIHTSCSQPIGVGFVFGPFEVVSGRSRNGGLFCDAECEPSQVHFKVEDDEIKFKIANDGLTPLQIQRVVAEWPAAKGSLVKIEFHGTIWEGLEAPMTADITEFNSGEDGDRALEAGNDHELKLRFTDKTKTGLHYVRVEFNNGCFIEADSDTPAGGSFDCSKPIDQLNMTWSGGGTVQVTAWKGSVGSTSLGTKTVSQGEEIFFAGFSGSPNDVFWEVFAGGTKIGESKFHLSCSDDEMDGAEDCYTRQGNGKSNEQGLINDWLFEGMVDSDETLDCDAP